jgi:hypothetical protein
LLKADLVQRRCLSGKSAARRGPVDGPNSPAGLRTIQGVHPLTKPTEEQIRQRAQEIWEENHRPTGRDDEFWYQAERELGQGATSEEKSETFLE